MVEVRQAVEGSQLGHSRLCALRNSVSLETQLPHLMEGPGSPPGRWHGPWTSLTKDQGSDCRLKVKVLPPQPRGWVSLTQADFLK